MHKSLYLFVCSWLGALLFLIVNRALLTIYLFLLSVDYSKYSFGLQINTLERFDAFVVFVFVMLGAWYGIWVGLKRYELVYEKGDHKGILFAFFGRLLNFDAENNRHSLSLSTNVLTKDHLLPQVVPVSAHELHVPMVVPKRVFPLVPKPKKPLLGVTNTTGVRVVNKVRQGGSLKAKQGMTTGLNIKKKIV
jgi:hypothetical protein